MLVFRGVLFPSVFCWQIPMHQLLLVFIRPVNINSAIVVEPNRFMFFFSIQSFGGVTL